MYLQFFFFAVGQWSSRLFTSFLAITLLFLSSRSLCFVLKLWPFFLASGFGIPIILTAALLIFDHKNISPKDKKNPNFQFGNAQAAITVFLLVCCFLVTFGCLVLHQRYKKKFDKYVTLSKEVSSPDSETTVTTNASVGSRSIPHINSEVTFGVFANRNVRRRHTSYSSSEDEDSPCQNGQINRNCCSQRVETTNNTSPPGTIMDIEDLLSPTAPESGGLCPTQFDCAGTSRENCQSLVQRYQEQSQYELEPLEYDESADPHQILKHTVLLILLLCSMFVVSWKIQYT
jgi:hypothetical protein